MSDRDEARRRAAAGVLMEIGYRGQPGRAGEALDILHDYIRGDLPERVSHLYTMRDEDLQAAQSLEERVEALEKAIGLHEYNVTHEPVEDGPIDEMLDLKWDDGPQDGAGLEVVAFLDKHGTIRYPTAASPNAATWDRRFPGNAPHVPLVRLSDATRLLGEKEREIAVLRGELHEVQSDRRDADRMRMRWIEQMERDVFGLRAQDKSPPESGPESGEVVEGVVVYDDEGEIPLIEPVPFGALPWPQGTPVIITLKRKGDDDA